MPLEELKVTVGILWNSLNLGVQSKDVAESPERIKAIISTVL